jgi:hypothetical protein
MSYQPIRFIAQEIEVEFDQPPALKKSPGCPDRFTWDGECFEVARSLGEWTDYTRRGRMQGNMRPSNAAAASRRGSWGVGRFYFRVKTDSGRIFELYYDRAPRDAGDREGSWYLYRELEETGAGSGSAPESQA